MISVSSSFFFFNLSQAGLLILLLSSFVINGYSQPLVPAIITFGDSSVDVGNNDYVPTVFKADFPPYGRDFINHKPSGRFCNGKLATDITAETLGFTSYPPAYLSPQASGKNLLIGANFASAGSGYNDETAFLTQTISMRKQLEYYKEYQGKLAKVAGSKQAASIIKDALYLNLKGLGARRIGATSLPPLGCLPVTITLFGKGENGCVSRINADAQGFNKKINAAASTLQKQLPGLKIVIFDIYTPFLDAINSPSKYGFSETRRGCCGTGLLETSLLCNGLSLGTCKNASQYIFWDSVHPSQAAKQVIADAVLTQGISLVG